MKSYDILYFNRGFSTFERILPDILDPFKKYIAYTKLIPFIVELLLLIYKTIILPYPTGNIAAEVMYPY